VRADGIPKRSRPPDLSQTEGVLVRLGNLAGRLTLFVDGGMHDVYTVSQGKYGPDPRGVYEVWDEFRNWVTTAALPTPSEYDPVRLGPPSPMPAQVFAIGLNYRSHAAEANSSYTDEFPLVFTKFPTSITGPNTAVVLPDGGDTDWEVELVVIMGRRAENVPADRAWDYVAGLTVGQDISERKLQMAGPAPQFSMGKSYPGFSPTGPWLVTPDELDNPDDLEIACAVAGETVQEARTSDLIFPVPRLIQLLSAVTPLLPGDLIFTGTPSGVGVGMVPPRYLRDSEELVSRIEGIGDIRQTFLTRPGISRTVPAG
jgi:2,4-didehydro-3-deoxy-L-rhamnonate hydrolase